MKRSDAERLIVDVINANTQDNPEELASYIIDELIDAGLVPPAVIRPVKIGSVYYRNELVNEWESE